VGYFNLSNDTNTLATRSTPQEMPVWEQIILYLVVVLGIILSSAVAKARAGQVIELSLNWPLVAVGAFIALVIFPAVWTAIGARADSPLLVRMGIAAQNGTFWSVLMTAAEKAVTPATTP